MKVQDWILLPISFQFLDFNWRTSNSDKNQSIFYLPKWLGRAVFSNFYSTWDVYFWPLHEPLSSIIAIHTEGMGFEQGEGRVSACMLQSVRYRSCPSKKILNPTFEPSFIENNYLIVSLIAKLGGCSHTSFTWGGRR